MFSKKTNKVIVAVALVLLLAPLSLFADLDPQAIHQEYLTRFMRINYDLSEHGVFVYPKP